MTGDHHTSGPLDVATLKVLARRAETHPLVSDWAFRPDRISPRRLKLHLDDDQYPEPVDATRVDVRWYEGGELGPSPEARGPHGTLPSAT